MSWLRKLSPTHTHALISICEFLKPYELLFFLVWVICKWLNANWQNIDSVILSFTCHSLINFSPIIHIPSLSICEFSKPYELLFLEFESFVKCKMWIVKKNHSIILSKLIHIPLYPFVNFPLYPFVNFQNPMSYYFLSLNQP